MQYPTGVATP